MVGLHIFDVHCPKHRRRQLFPTSTYLKDVSLGFPLCHPLSSRGSMSCCLFSCFWRVLPLPPFPESDHLSSVIFKWVTLPACLALGSNIFLCLAFEIKFASVRSSPLSFLQVVRTVIMQLRTSLHTGPPSSKTAFAMNCCIFSSSFPVYIFHYSFCSLHTCLILACSVKYPGSILIL